MTDIAQIAARAKEASRKMKQLSGEARTKALFLMAEKLAASKEDLFRANAEDLAAAPFLTEACRNRKDLQLHDEPPERSRRTAGCGREDPGR